MMTMPPKHSEMKIGKKARPKTIARAKKKPASKPGFRVSKGRETINASGPPHLSPPPSVVQQVAGLDLASSGLEFEKRMDRYHERTRRRSSLRRALILWLSKSSLA
jgi:hypothetical protein